jgi:hypothetical protein
MPVVQLDKPRNLVFDLNAMSLFEEATGKNIFEGGLDKLSAKNTRALLWACLVHEDKALTVDQVGKLITSKNMAEVSKTLAGAFSEGSSPLESGTTGAESIPA